MDDEWRQMSDFEKTNWLATRVMGWHSDRDLTPGAEYVYWYDGLNRLMLIHEWQPLIALDHSLLVACKLRDKGLWVTVQMRPNSSSGKHKWCCILEDRTNCWNFVANGDNLADVICESAWLMYGPRA